MTSYEPVTYASTFIRVISDSGGLPGLSIILGGNLKVHKIENFFGSDFEFCVISLLVMLKY
jgi:hypothetical protein